MKPRIVFVVMLLLAVVALFGHSTGCKKNPVAPQTDPRNLSWSVDTLAHPDNWQVLISDIWASSAKDVYVAGGANTTRGILWHYGGSRWRDIEISITEGGPIAGAINFDDIYGFGPNDVWFVGDRIIRNPNPPPDFVQESLIVHYDGAEWREIPSPPGGSLNTVWGPAPDDIWFGGTNGTLFHYDGASMQADSIPQVLRFGDESSFFNTVGISGDATNAYMLVVMEPHTRDTRYFFLEHLAQKWVLQDSTFYFNTNRLWQSPWGTLYVTGESTYQRRNGTWEELLGCCNTLTSTGIHSTSPDNLFLVGRSQVSPYPGTVYHFNGADWATLPSLEKPDQRHIEMWTDGREVFITTRFGNGSMVYHGK